MIFNHCDLTLFKSFPDFDFHDAQKSGLVKNLNFSPLHGLIIIIFPNIRDYSEKKKEKKEPDASKDDLEVFVNTFDFFFVIYLA